MEDPLGFHHRYVPTEDRSAPVLLLLHGTGGTEHDLLELGRSLLPQAALLSPRGKVLEHGMARFFQRLAEGVFDEEDLIRRTDELADFVASAVRAYGLEGRRIVAVGYSNGANLAASTLLLRPGVLAGAVLLRGMVPLVPRELPDLRGARIFMANGRRDPILPVENADRLAEMLQTAGAEVTQHWTEGGHQLEESEIEEARRWLATF